MLSRFSRVRLLVTPWTVSLLLCPWNFPGQEYWSGLLCPLPGDLPDPGIKPTSPVSPVLQTDSLPLSYQEGCGFLVGRKEGSPLFLFTDIQFASLSPKAFPILNLEFLTFFFFSLIEFLRGIIYYICLFKELVLDFIS